MKKPTSECCNAPRWNQTNLCSQCLKRANFSFKKKEMCEICHDFEVYDKGICHNCCTQSYT